MNMRAFKILCFNLLIVTGIYSCKKFVTVPNPVTELVQADVFEDDATVSSAVASLYSKLSDGQSFADGFINSVTVFEGLYSDELVSYAPITSTSPRVEFYLNIVTPLNEIVANTWSGCYKIIYECNRIIEGLNKSKGVSQSLKASATGEAKFIRAFCHFYLVELYGPIPLVTTTDYRLNSSISRTPKSDVYDQIIIDLSEAIQLLSDAYPSPERVRINKGAAIALLSRIYLYKGDYEKAEQFATRIIDKTNQYYLPNDPDSVFLKTSSEAIFQLLPRSGLQNFTNEGFYFILIAPPSNVALRNEFADIFEENDLRRNHWIGSIKSSSGFTTWYYPHKYKERSENASGSEYSMVLRLAEQYLIRAEARAHQHKLTGVNSAESDINVIRSRAGLENTIAATKEELLNAIAKERRVELFTEWGHRFFDLKRTKKLDEVLGLVKPNWNSTDSILPIPQNELLLNGNLAPQNQGY